MLAKVFILFIIFYVFSFSFVSDKVTFFLANFDLAVDICDNYVLKGENNSPILPILNALNYDYFS